MPPYPPPLAAKLTAIYEDLLWLAAGEWDTGRGGTDRDLDNDNEWDFGWGGTDRDSDNDNEWDLDRGGTDRGLDNDNW